MKAFIYVLIFSFFSPFIAFASIITPTTNCDTLMSAEGRVILVEILAITDSTIQFRSCGNRSAPKIELPRSAVREIRPNTNGADIPVLSPAEEYRLTKRAKAAAFWGWAPLIFSPLLIVAQWWLPLIPLEIFGFIFTIWVISKIPKTKTYKKQRGWAIFGLIGSIYFALLVLVVYLVINALSQSQ